jgi:hypothetical protein
MSDATIGVPAAIASSRTIPKDAPGLAGQRSLADDKQAAVAARLAQDPVRLQQVEQALARLVPAHEQQVPLAVLPAGQRDRALEAGDVDAVRDHLVLAREVAVDEVLRRAADRDPAVETLGVAAHDPAAELVRRREAAVGVERGDVHARREPQDDRRQERHERLVEVEEVEAFPLEHVADLRHVARRQRDRPDRAVDRQREALADADHVALGRALEAVRRRQDPDVVAAQPEVLVEVADVLGHTARQRVDVRRDEPDLHRPAPSTAACSAARTSSRRGGRWRPPG